MVDTTAQYMEIWAKITSELRNNMPNEPLSTINKMVHDLAMHELRNDAFEMLPPPPPP